MTTQLALGITLEGEHPAYVPNDDPHADLCFVGFHGRVLARDERGRTVCAHCGGPVPIVNATSRAPATVRVADAHTGPGSDRARATRSAENAHGEHGSAGHYGGHDEYALTEAERAPQGQPSGARAGATQNTGSAPQSEYAADRGERQRDEQTRRNEPAADACAREQDAQSGGAA